MDVSPPRKPVWLAHFEGSCFDEDISYRMVSQNPLKRRPFRVLEYRAVQTVFILRPQTSKPRTFSVDRSRENVRRLVKYLVSKLFKLCTIRNIGICPIGGALLVYLKIPAYILADFEF